jgi:hypothetical protein
MKKNTAKILSLIVIVAGIVVMLGWIFDMGILKSISPAWISMKFDTAIAFLFSGITLFFIARALEGEFDQAQVILSITSLIIILLMGTLFFSSVLGIKTGVEDLFVTETVVSARTVIPGLPSIPTMLNFILIALAGILTILDIKKVQLKLKVIGLTIGIIGMLALAGYFFNVPLIYYYIKGINSAMAIHTAILFIFLGAGFLCL